MDTRKLLEELENVIDSATEVPFSNKKMVDKDEIERLIDAINQSLPNELESARRIVADKERILLDAEKKADDTIAQAKDYIARITEESELVKQAQERANEVVTSANHSAEELRSSSVTYATDGLKYVETNMENMLDTLKKKRSGEDSVVAEITESGNANEENRVLVYVVGAVKEPGVYELQRGSRVYDAVQAAGNVLPYADMEGVNMAEPVEDAMRVYIPLNPERTTPAAAGLVNINHASGTELETLPGIGAKTADKIIEYRNEHGGFRSKEELKEVPTIGEGKYAKVSERITL